MIDIPEADARELGRMRLLGSGGQGRVLRLVDHPDGPDAVVYKEYSPRVVDEVDVDALRRFVGFAADLDGTTRSRLLSRAAWPEVVVRKDGVVVGFLMRKAPVAYSTTMRFGEETTTELALVQYLLNPPGYLADRGLELSPRFRYELLHDTAEALALMHRLGISVGDLSPNNLLFSLTARPRGFFIDCDAMRLDGQSVLPQVETPDWRISDLGAEEQATPASDSYKLGLLAIRLFANDQQSTNPKLAPDRLRGKVTASLNENPAKRPTAQSWIGPLAAAASEAAEESDTPPATPRPRTIRLREPRQRRVAQQRRYPLGWRWAAVPAFLLAVFYFVIQVVQAGGPNTPSSSSGGPGLADLTTARLPRLPDLTAAGLPTLDLPRPTFTLPTGAGRLALPTQSEADLRAELQCRLYDTAAPDVRGGDGLVTAREVLTQVCDLGREDWFQPIAKPLVPLSDHAPFTQATIVGYWGEGTASPRVTADLIKTAGGCVRASIRFTADYVVSSSAVLGTC
ncbi:serine/threonine protein kinase [Actinokineospora baliensis]|uniref:hypothetical protein n=1 Tax=Actinokineospora baliensis TaxID=547056 RepID=UPI00195D5687|nr:hypothetical protein [Actinokineospora baliensis]MBM7775029.1 serine/threonine protein kinase [Actinokineospora baliensis]